MKRHRVEDFIGQLPENALTLRLGQQPCNIQALLPIGRCALTDAIAVNKPQFNPPPAAQGDYRHLYTGRRRSGSMKSFAEKPGEPGTMTRSIVWKEQTRFIEDAVETWKLAHEQAMQALELDAVLQVCAVLGDYVQNFMALMWEELFSGKLLDVQEKGAFFQKCFDQSVAAFAEFAAVAREFRDSGHELAHYAAFVAAHGQLLRLKDDFERRWPRFRVEELKARLAQPAEFVDAEEIYREFPELRCASQG